MADYLSQTSEPSAFAKPYVANYLNMANQYAGQAYQPYQGERVAGFDPFQQQGYQAMGQRALQGSPVMGAANTQLQNTIQGDYLKGNPYLDDMINKSQGDVVRNYNQTVQPATERAMQQSGSFGNSGLMQFQMEQQRALQESLGGISTQMRGQNYEAERNRQQQAMGMAPAFANQDYIDAQALVTAGQGFQNQNQRQLDNAYQQWDMATNQYPLQRMQALGQALGGNTGMTQSQQQPEANRTAQILGGALTGTQIAKMLTDSSGGGSLWDGISSLWS